MFDADLPITLTTEGLFESDDKKSQYLLTKLTGWLNFQALAANWYEDENKVVELSFTLLPEKLFLAQELNQDKPWQTVSEPELVAVYLQHANKMDFIFMLSNDELNTVMTDGAKLEPLLQNKLKTLANVAANTFELTPLP